MSFQYHFLNRLVFGAQLEWLKDGNSLQIWNNMSFCRSWLWDTLPQYKALPLRYKPRVMVKEDRFDQERLAALDPKMTLLMQWIEVMVEESNPLREKVALFWHHHLPSAGGREVGHTRQLLEVFRKQGLGNLKELLNEVIKTPAFQRFLDLRGSHKDRPNENFAREFLELHTLGEGNYDLKDVKEAARAFTGFNYQSKPPYHFILDHLAHDFGKKDFLGKNGDLGATEVIDIILNQKATAKHIATSFLHFFFSDNPSPSIIAHCTHNYRISGYEMTALINAMLDHPDFSSPIHFGKRVKTPVELLVGLQRQLGFRLIGQKSLRYYLMKCGHRPFNPPTVAGWKGGIYWLQGEKLLYRTFLPGAFLDIANRSIPRQSIAYKVISRIYLPSRRKLRYFSDAVWDKSRLFERLSSSDISISEWLLSKDNGQNSVRMLISNPDYQYC